MRWGWGGEVGGVRDRFYLILQKVLLLVYKVSSVTVVVFLQEQHSLMKWVLTISLGNIDNILHGRLGVDCIHYFQGYMTVH